MENKHRGRKDPYRHARARAANYGDPPSMTNEKFTRPLMRRIVITSNTGRGTAGVYLSVRVRFAEQTVRSVTRVARETVKRAEAGICR